VHYSSGGCLLDCLTTPFQLRTLYSTNGNICVNGELEKNMKGRGCCLF